MANPIQGRRLLELDSFRGIASLGVVLFHYYYHVFEAHGPGLGKESQMVKAFDFGQYGVELFFMISGFVIFMTLERTKSVLDFIVSRLARLFPVYWLSIAITTAAVWSFGLAGREVSLVDTLINLTMLEEFANVPKVDGAYWTLTLELCFYMLIGTAWFTGALKRVNLAAGIALAGLFAGQVLLHNGVDIPWKIKTFFLLEYGHLFLLGMLLYRVWKGELNLITGLLAIGCIELAFLHGVLVGGLVIAFTGLFLAFRAGWLGFLAIKPFLFLGAISYSLYIVHQNTGYVILRELTDAGLAWPIAQVLTTLLVILIATGMTYLVERPAARFIRGLWKKRQKRLAPQAA